jgi:pseudaminic acid biosynthesis-associated methylase
VSAVKTARPRDAWRGAFGDAYTDRNPRTLASLESRQRLFQRALGDVPLGAGSRLLEVGTNVGMNLSALGRCSPASLFGVDLNERALARARSASDLAGRVRLAAAQAERLPFPDASMDLVLTCGVLIHIPPEQLREACAEIVRVARRYVFCAEYFSPRPEEVSYRGESGLLFKRDFGTFYLEQWPELQLVDYGFVWKRVEFDDLNWWLFEKATRP